MTGKFISFEGPDGSGKSTQVRLLAEYLSRAGYDIVATREPGGTDTAEKIRKLLLDPLNKKITDRTEVLLYAASRAQHVEELIKPALAQGKFVICDRFIDSTIAYQGFGRNLNLDLLDMVNKVATGGLLPDLTVLLDISPEVGLNRIKDLRHCSKDRLEQETVDFHRRVRQGYLYLAEKYPQRIKIIRADESKDRIFQEVKVLLDHLLGKHR
jgi:dTMP kinase